MPAHTGVLLNKITILPDIPWLLRVGPRLGLFPTILTAAARRGQIKALSKITERKMAIAHTDFQLRWLLKLAAHLDSDDPLLSSEARHQLERIADRPRHSRDRRMARTLLTNKRGYRWPKR